MIGKDLPKSNIRNNDFIDVVFGRRATPFMNPDFKVDREEIVEIFSEMNACTPSAVNTQPYKFLVIDSDEGKKKIDSIMRPPFDRDRTTSCSFAVVVFADRKWIEGFDELYQNEITIVPDYPEMMVPVTYEWYEKLTAGDGSYLDKSINFQAGQASMMLQCICRAHELDTSVMDAWDPSCSPICSESTSSATSPRSCSPSARAPVLRSSATATRATISSSGVSRRLAAGRGLAPGRRGGKEAQA